MLLAIDVGNTHTVCGVWSKNRWQAIWRKSTRPEETEDEVAAWLKTMFDLGKLEWQIDSAICSSVVPQVEATWTRLGNTWLKTPVRFLRNGSDVGLDIDYDPPHAVGADRIANAIAALDRFQPPIIVIDFGTATTFDAIGARGTYLGGAILPGVTLSSEALFSKAAKLPTVPYIAPETALGRNTIHSMQSGIMLGYAGAIDALANQIRSELGGNARVIATGGLAGLFMGICKSIESCEPTLTLDGLVIAASRLP